MTLRFTLSSSLDTRACSPCPTSPVLLLASELLPWDAPHPHAPIASCSGRIRALCAQQQFRTADRLASRPTLGAMLPGSLPCAETTTACARMVPCTPGIMRTRDSNTPVYDHPAAPFVTRTGHLLHTPRAPPTSPFAPLARRFIISTNVSPPSAVNRSQHTAPCLADGHPLTEHAPSNAFASVSLNPLSP